jgi:hypothetical protein
VIAAVRPRAATDRVHRDDPIGRETDADADLDLVDLERRERVLARFAAAHRAAGDD